MAGKYCNPALIIESTPLSLSIIEFEHYIYEIFRIVKHPQWILSTFIYIINIASEVIAASIRHILNRSFAT